MGIYIEKSGLLTTVQDHGRYGFQNSGFSVSGVMDSRSAGTANALVDNEISEAVLEFLLMGPTIRFTKDAHIAITGADFSPKLNGEAIASYKALKVKEGDVLEMGLAKGGLWGYLSFAEKLDIPEAMGSRSTNIRCTIGGYCGRKLEPGDQIGFRSYLASLPGMKKRIAEPENFGEKEKTIRVILGLQKDHFTQKGIDTFLSEPYTVTQMCDRMGYRLDGPQIEHKDGGDIISDGIPLGAIQVPGHGKPIIMLVDRQTTGGYTKIGTVIGVDIPSLVQSPAGTVIRFKEVSVEEAQELYAAQLKKSEDLKAELGTMTFMQKILSFFKN